MSMTKTDRIEGGTRVIRYHDNSVKWREDCDTCARYATDRDPATGFFPDHDAMRGCRSGRRSHCTCDGCF